MDAAKFFPPENTTSAFYKFSIVRENSAQRQKQHKNTKKKKNEERNARSGRGKNQKKKEVTIAFYLSTIVAPFSRFSRIAGYAILPARLEQVTL